MIGKFCNLALSAFLLTGLPTSAVSANPKELAAQLPTIVANCEATLGNAKPGWAAVVVSRRCGCAAGKIKTTFWIHQADTMRLVPDLASGNFLEAWHKLSQINTSAPPGWFHCFDD